MLPRRGGLQGGSSSPVISIKHSGEIPVYLSNHKDDFIVEQSSVCYCRNIALPEFSVIISRSQDMKGRGGSSFDRLQYRMQPQQPTTDLPLPRPRPHLHLFIHPASPPLVNINLISISYFLPLTNHQLVPFLRVSQNAAACSHLQVPKLKHSNFHGVPSISSTSLLITNAATTSWSM